ncbi:MAG: MFS transporter [Planctomycetota bacterium]
MPGYDETPQEQLPPLPTRNRSFLRFLGTQALGAFNDNVFKQLVLLLSLGYIAAGTEFQTVVQFLFALPFLIFSGFAGDLSDRFSKGSLMVACKVAEIGVMVLGLLVFATMVVDTSGEVPSYLWLLAIVTFLMGTQSAFFGPPKYGGLPELVRERDLSRATGLTQMTTFFAIILGVALAGWLLDEFSDRLWLPGGLAVLIAVAGTWMSLGIARRPPSDPDRRLTARSFVSIWPTLRDAFRHDRLLFDILLVYSWFWLVGGVVLQSLNVYGRLQLGFNNFETSLLVSTMSIGIAIGSIAVARLSKDKVRLKLIVPGLIAMVTLLILFVAIPVHAPTGPELERFAELKNAPREVQDSVELIPQAGTGPIVAAVLLSLLLGASAGFYSVPLLAFIQARPDAADKGQVFASANWLNWVFILGSSAVYGTGMSWTSMRASLLLPGLGLLTLVVLPWPMLKIFRRLHRERPDFVALS